MKGKSFINFIQAGLLAAGTGVEHESFQAFEVAPIFAFVVPPDPKANGIQMVNRSGELFNARASCNGTVMKAVPQT